MESNHPAHARCARPVLKTGGATGPLPSPIAGGRVSDTKPCDAWEGARARAYSTRPVKREKSVRLPATIRYRTSITHTNGGRRVILAKRG